MTDHHSSIEQINLGFNQHEDRLLLKVGMADQSELTIWLTRRVCKDLWHLLQNSHQQIVGNLKQLSGANGNQAQHLLNDLTPSKTLEEESTNPSQASQKEQAIANFNYEKDLQKSLENMDFKTDYIANRTPLSASPILATDIRVEITTEKSITSLMLKTQNGELIKMDLTLELVVALTNMMQYAVRDAGWDLLILQNSVALDLLPSEQVLH